MPPDVLMVDDLRLYKQGYVWDAESLERFERLTLRRGVSVSGLFRNPQDGDCFCRGMLCLCILLLGTGFHPRHIWIFTIDRILRDTGHWLADNAEIVFDAMLRKGFWQGRGDCYAPSCELCTELTYETAFEVMDRLRQQRCENRRRIRNALQQRNREMNRPTAPRVDKTLDESIMLIALAEARQAESEGEVPVGAVIVRDGQVLAKAHNAVLSLHDPTAHAEMLVIRQAAAKLGNERLVGCDLYVTLEPCAMCSAAIAHARISRVIWGADDKACGGMQGKVNVAEAASMNHRAHVTSGVCQQACQSVLKEFFSKLRRQTMGA